MPAASLERTLFLLLMERYSKIETKKKREIVLLRGRGCIYKKCAFCDYYRDSSPDDEKNFLLNASVLDKVTGEFGELEVINSGSVFELDINTIESIKAICLKKDIHTIHFEAHYLYNNRIPEFRKEFEQFDLKMKLGLETFDYHFRENVLKKGIGERSPKALAKNFNEANFLFGIKGQDVHTMKRDIETGLTYFERICLNIMCPNSSQIPPDKEVINSFVREIYPLYSSNDRVDILIKNTDFGVGN